MIRCEVRGIGEYRFAVLRAACLVLVAAILTACGSGGGGSGGSSGGSGNFPQFAGTWYGSQTDIYNNGNPAYFVIQVDSSGLATGEVGCGGHCGSYQATATSNSQVLTMTAEDTGELSNGIMVVDSASNPAHAVVLLSQTTGTPGFQLVVLTKGTAPSQTNGFDPGLTWISSVTGTYNGLALKLNSDGTFNSATSGDTLTIGATDPSCLSSICTVSFSSGSLSTQSVPSQTMTAGTTASGGSADYGLFGSSTGGLISFTVGSTLYTYGGSAFTLTDGKAVAIGVCNNKCVLAEGQGLDPSQWLFSFEWH